MSYSLSYAPHMSAIPSNPIFDLLPKLNDPEFISFAAGVPSPGSFPVAELSDMMCELMSQDGKLLMQYGTTEGYAPLRESITELFIQSGIPATMDDMFITSGGQQTIDLLCKLLIQPGDAVLVETPTYSAALQILHTYRANSIGVESDDDGIFTDDLEAKIIEHKPKLIYLIPNFQNPSGRTMCTERRREVARISAKYGVPVLEDDPYRFLRYSNEHLPTIKSFDRDGNVIYLTSTSKILCPGLRVGAAHVSRDLKEHLVVAKQAVDMHSSNISQALVDKYFRAGLIMPHIDEICAQYRVKLKVMMEAMESEFPAEVKHTTPEGGLFIWCELPKKYDTTALLPVAVDQKVAFIPGDQFFAQEGVNNYMRLNFSNASEENLVAGIERLGKLLRSI